MVKLISVSILVLMLLSVVLAKPNRHYKDEEGHLENYSLAPIAHFVTDPVYYYEEGEGPTDDDEEDTVDTQPAKKEPEPEKEPEGPKEDEGEDADDKENYVPDQAYDGANRIISRVMKGPKRSELPANASAEQVFLYLSSLAGAEFEKAFKSIFPLVYDYAYNVDLNPLCMSAMGQFGAMARVGKPWAMKSKLRDSLGQIGGSLGPWHMLENYGP